MQDINDYQKLIDEYSADYCHFLEAAYGQGMMSEGGAEAIEKMFSGIDLNGKRILDVGCGLGGILFYLAQNYDCRITGLELNPWMVEEAIRRIPSALQHKVDFSGYQAAPKTNFADASFDLIFSKGVLTHVNNKLPLFQELYRITKPAGQLIIDDWLSPTKGRWGERVQKMCDVEDLTLYAETETGYQELLIEAGFNNIHMQGCNTDYNRYNQQIVDTLLLPDNRKKFLEQFDQQALQEAIECYQIIADAIKDDELLIRCFKAEKR